MPHEYRGTQQQRPDLISHAQRKAQQQRPDLVSLVVLSANEGVRYHTYSEEHNNRDRIWLVSAYFQQTGLDVTCTTRDTTSQTGFSWSQHIFSKRTEGGGDGCNTYNEGHNIKNRIWLISTYFQQTMGVRGQTYNEEAATDTEFY